MQVGCRLSFWGLLNASKLFKTYSRGSRDILKPLVRSTSLYLAQTTTTLYSTQIAVRTFYAIYMQVGRRLSFCGLLNASKLFKTHSRGSRNILKPLVRFTTLYLAQTTTTLRYIARKSPYGQFTLFTCKLVVVWASEAFWMLLNCVKLFLEALETF